MNAIHIFHNPMHVPCTYAMHQLQYIPLSSSPSMVTQVLPYAYSKTVAEQKAWELVKAQSSWDLVTVNPGLVMGPPAPGYRRADSESIDIVQQLCTGKMPMGEVVAFEVLGYHPQTPISWIILCI